MQVARALPLLEWTARERERVVDILLRDVKHPQKFVRGRALDSLAAFAEGSGLIPVVERTLQDFHRSGSKALAARARHRELHKR